MPALPQHESRKDSDRPGRRQREGNVAVCPTDGEAVVPRKVDKQSLDYLWRTGTAGGIAGCAVSIAESYPFLYRIEGTRR
jgi:solute carrier family 25 (mitochondrial carrier protein), member 16